MDTQRIFEGKTVDHAIEEALKHFNCSRDELEIEVITKGSTGIFGIGGRKAQIRVTHTPKVEEEPHEALADETGAISEETGLEAREGGVPTGDSQPGQGMPQTETGGEAPKGLDAGPFVEEARDVLGDLLKLSHVEATVEVVDDPQNGPCLNIESEDLSLIIGKNGQNLNAFKYVTNLIMKRRHTECPTIEVDAQGYLEKRRLQVESTARRMAEKAKRTGRSMSLEPMNAKERRIVHLAVKRIKGVTTKSIGEGEARRVVIFPQKKRGGGRQRQRRVSRQSNSRGRRH